MAILGGKSLQNIEVEKMRSDLSVTAVAFILCSFIMVTSCGSDSGPPRPEVPILEGKMGQWLTDGSVSLRAVECREAVGPMSGASLAMQFKIANSTSSTLRFEKISVDFQVNNPNRTQSPELKDRYIPTTNALVTKHGDGYRVTYGLFGIMPPKAPEGTVLPFVLPKGVAMELEVNNAQVGLFSGDLYKVIIKAFSGQTVYGPFTVNVAATYDDAKKEFIFR